MAVNSERFRLALDRLGPGDWEVFEGLASTFLASDYPNLRTMASPSGDGGRDSELFSDESDDQVVFQYSVTKDWPKKIRSTIARLKSTAPKVNSLIYVTNKQIGADADSLRKQLRQNGFFLDIYDRSWFVERTNSGQAREAAAEELAVAFVDPLVSKRAIDNDLVSALKGEEAKTALIFLEMQVEDSTSAYGLTKSSYDALTRAALRATDTANRMTRREITNKVSDFLPTHSETVVAQRVNAALIRLTSSNAIRHRKDNDEFHLTDSEVARVGASLAHLKAMKDDFDSDILNELVKREDVVIEDGNKFAVAARTIVETYFFRKGESFATSVVKAEPHKFDDTTIRSIVSQKSSLNFGVKGSNKIIVMGDIRENVLNLPTEKTAIFLKSLSESYTLFAFLAATPDVQKATRQMFTSGEIWLDTSVVLPILAEHAAPTSQMVFTNIYRQCVSADLRLYVTAGVLEEVERHINKCEAYLHSTSWNGPVPYLYATYLSYGGTASGFRPWLENFIGDVDRIQDVADYLKREHSIRVESASDHPNVSDDLARAIEAKWQEVHVDRRSRNSGDTLHAFRLAAHDSEPFLHVLSSRIGQRGKAPLGYSDWWLTLDRSARGILNEIEKNLVPAINIGPVLSLEYLVQYLAFGPNREKVDLSGTALAKVYADVLVEPLPQDMVDILEAVRADNLDVPEAVVQRRIRDRLNVERSKLGSVDIGNLEGTSDKLRTMF